MSNLLRFQSAEERAFRRWLNDCSEGFVQAVEEVPGVWTLFNDVGASFVYRVATAPAQSVLWSHALAICLADECAMRRNSVPIDDLPEHVQQQLLTMNALDQQEAEALFQAAKETLS